MRVLLVLLVLLGSTRAFAGDDREQRAQAFWAEGQARYNVQAWDEAIDCYIKAYKIYPYPDILFNIAQAYRGKGDLEQARFYYLSYLREAPADASDRAEVQKRVSELDKQLAEKKAAQPPPVSEKPVKPIPDQPPAPPPPTGPAWYQDGWGWTWTGLGVVAGGVATWAFLDARRLDDEAGEVDETAATDLYARAHDRRVLGGIVGGVGLALITTGVIKLAITGDAPAASVSLAPGGLVLGLSGRF